MPTAIHSADPPLAELCMDEVREAAEDFNRALEKLKQCERRSERYFDLLCGDLWVKVEIVRTKAAGAKQESDRLSNQRDRLERQQKSQKRKRNHRPARNNRSGQLSDLVRHRAS
jgi:hypothetical protein